MPSAHGAISVFDADRHRMQICVLFKIVKFTCIFATCCMRATFIKMATDELPKDYSSVYREDKPPVPPMRTINSTILSDGVRVSKKQCESTVDLRRVVAKLHKLPQANHSAYALDTLNKHYSSVFVNKRRTSYKAYITYYQEKDTYVVRVDNNTLGAIRDKLPKRGNFRYFFKSMGVCEEIESDEDIVPFQEKDGVRQIHCQLFPLIYS